MAGGRAAEEALREAVHHVARAHRHEALGAQVVDRHRVLRGPGVVGGHHHDRRRAPAASRRARRGLVAAQQVHQAEVERALETPSTTPPWGRSTTSTEVVRRARCTARIAGATTDDVAVFTVPTRTVRVTPFWSPAAVRSRSTASSTSVMWASSSRPDAVDPGPAAAAVKQGHAELALELADTLAQGRLRDVQVLAGPPQRAVLHDCCQVLELLEPHAHSLPSGRCGLSPREEEPGEGRCSDPACLLSCMLIDNIQHASCPRPRGRTR